MNEEIKYTVVKGVIKYVDELSDEYIEIPKAQFIRYIQSTYLITPKMYYDRVMDKRNIIVGKCLVCGNEVKFNNIFKGYGKYCSMYCRNIGSSCLGNLIKISPSGLVTYRRIRKCISTYKLSQEIDISESDGMKFPDFLKYLESKRGTWVSGLNHSRSKFSKQYNHLIIKLESVSRTVKPLR